MPVDKNGKPLKAGDKVLIEAEVYRLSEAKHGLTVFVGIPGMGAQWMMADQVELVEDKEQGGRDTSFGCHVELLAAAKELSSAWPENHPAFVRVRAAVAAVEGKRA